MRSQSPSFPESVFPGRSRHAEVLRACSVRFPTERHSSLAASEVAAMVLMVWRWGRGGETWLSVTPVSFI